MNVDKDDTNFEELARCCDDFNGAQCKAICVEVKGIAVLESKIILSLQAGMLALQRGQHSET